MVVRVSQAAGRGVSMLFLLLAVVRATPAGEFIGAVVDAETGKPLPARIYLRDADGQWLFVQSADPEGSALAYREQWVPMPDSVERHTTLSAHPFRVDLKPGTYRLEIERGKEYHPLIREITIGDSPQRETFRLRRWVDMAGRGWYSGETHVHRRIEELPNVMLAEDLNVAFPVTFWTTDAFAVPGLDPSPLRRQGPSPFGPRADRGSEPIVIDATHVMYPRNTEYEIFSIDGKRHTLGAVFVLNHKTRFTQGMPPVARIAAQAHAEGALLDLDKHSWPWSMMLVPIAKVDLFELSNNSVWRTRFGFRRAAVAPAPYMQVEFDGEDLTEWGWLSYGFENYYTLLNCGFRLQPTAGTASGVHPVPLGYSRVYVHTPDSFQGDRWIEGLRKGHSFVTTGPMLLAQLDGQHPGHSTRHAQPGEFRHRLRIESISRRPLDRVEVLVNGRVVRTIRPGDAELPNGGKSIVDEHGAHRLTVDLNVPVSHSCWIAARSVQRNEDGRVQFAHTAPWHIEVADQPVRPRREEVQFLVGRLRDEIRRNQSVLPAESLEEFQRALEIYEALMPHTVQNDP
jgi:hypothetical protein